MDIYQCNRGNQEMARDGGGESEREMRKKVEARVVSEFPK